MLTALKTNCIEYLECERIAALEMLMIGKKTHNVTVIAGVQLDTSDSICDKVQCGILTWLYCFAK